MATLTAAPADGDSALEKLRAEGVDILEVRADLVGDLDPAPLRGRFAGQAPLHAAQPRRGRRLRGLARAPAPAPDRGRRALRLRRPRGRRAISTPSCSPACRPRSGSSPGTARRRGSTALKATLRPASPRSRPASTSWSRPPRRPATSWRRCSCCTRLRRRDVIAFAAGAGGAWTRLRRAPPRRPRDLRRGWATSPARRGRSRSRACARDYGLPELPPVEALFGLVGNPVPHSLSPRIHNSAYRELGHPGALPAVPRRRRSATSGWRWSRAACSTASASPSAASR